ncbi:NAD(P)-binding domain-containing protein, partial [Bacteriovoracaceae bacterium]|nr:NAD(P)-binding domain-containing protein [Bacteriovoracaceae bacterium]
MINRKNKHCIIGAGPCGLAAARNFSKYGLEFDAFEMHTNVGGLWDIESPTSTMYESAHLISSKTKMQYEEFKFCKETADYPHHSEMRKYFHDFAKEFDLHTHYKFETRIDKAVRDTDGNWEVTYTNLRTAESETAVYGGLITANGIFSAPNLPKFKGQENFKGKIIHSSEYKTAKIFEGKSVLIIGAGNSGCDIAVDACHRARCVDISVRRGYYFIPKYIFGKPSDTVGAKTTILPKFLRKRTDKYILKMFTGDPVNFGFPKPDYDLFQSHPIVNSLILHHLGHGDISVKADVDYLNGNTVYFKDGTEREYDLVLCATGYKLNYPFLD